MQFRDLNKQYDALKSEIEREISKVISSSKFISGPQVKELELKLAEYVGVKHCISCANGTDAITLAMMAWNIGEGDAVFVPDFTFFASGESPAVLGATPIFVDVDEQTFNMDPEKLEKAINTVLCEGKYKPKAVVAVDLFGLPADYPKIRQICKKYDLLLLEDGAQGFGGSIEGKMACSFGDISTTSFFPAKPLGCYGDGGAVFTDNDDWAELIRSFTVHGKSGSDKYNNIRIGMNSRLDTLQAALLLPKFNALKKYEIDAVNTAAKTYDRLLKDSRFVTPYIPKGYISSRAQYTLKLPFDTNREELQLHLENKGIPSMVYYPKPMHLQGAFEGTRSSVADCKTTEYLCRTVLSIPMHPYLEDNDVLEVCNSILEFFDK